MKHKSQSSGFQMNYNSFFVWFRSKGQGGICKKFSLLMLRQKNGFLVFQDISYKNKKWSLTSGYGLFDTDGYG